MDVSSPSKGTRRRALRWLVIGTFVTLALLLLVLWSHAATGSGSLVLPYEVLSVVLGAFTLATLFGGVTYYWGAYPQHRRAILFIVALTLIVFSAHVYILGNPPAANPTATISGAVGGQLVSPDNDDLGHPQVTISSSQSGQQLRVTLKATGNGDHGGKAIIFPELVTPAQATGAGFSPQATLQSPLEPGDQVTGTWTVNGNVTSIGVSYQELNCYKSSYPSEYGCIMDEIFYVPEGMSILNGQQCFVGNNAPTDCHPEHPWLGPGLIAAGMAVLGEFNSAGWRLFDVLLGTFSIPLLVGIAWKLSGSKRTAYVASVLLALDVMFFSQSSAALLDTPEIFFGLAAFFAYFAGLRWWKFDKYVIAGVFMGLAGLAKETAIFLMLALLTYILFFDEGGVSKKTRSMAKVVIVVGLVFIGGLEAYDSVLMLPSQAGTSSCPMNGNTFVQQIDYILCYGSGLIATKLQCMPITGYWCRWANDPGGPPILPMDWVTFYAPVTYFSTSVTVCPNSVNGTCQGGEYSYVALAYYGVTNFLETWTIYVWIPLVAYSLYRFYRKKDPGMLAAPGEMVTEATGTEAEQTSEPAPSQDIPPTAMPIDTTSQGAAPTPTEMQGDLKLAAFSLVLFFWTYVPYLFLYLAGRVTYPFYFLDAVPAVALGCTFWVTRSWFPKWLMYVYIFMAFVFFFIYFPEKGFLPDWLRVLIGH